MKSSRQQLADAVHKAFADHVWRSVAKAPKDGTVTIVCAPGRRCVGIYKNGEWVSERGKALPFVPTLWLGFTDG